jgi:hypothetical protein
MKHVIASLTVGACLLLPLTGVVFAADPHKPSTLLPNPNPTGQPGTAKMATGGTTGISCSAYIPPGNSAGSMRSPTSANPPNYAGQGTNPTAPPPSLGGLGEGVGNPAHSVSEYDVAYFQQSSRMQLK